MNAELTGVFKMEPELFNYGIGEYFAGDSLYFGVCGGRIECVSQPDDKIFSLPHVLDSLILHLSERAVDGLPLRVKDRLLEGDIDMSLHFA